MDLKQTLAPTITNEEFSQRYSVLHKRVYASPPFEFDAVTSKMYDIPDGFYGVDHCLVHDGENWHLYYVTGEIKNYLEWSKAYYGDQNKEAFKKVQYEIGDGHAVGKSLEHLEFKNIILTEIQGSYDTFTRGNVHIVRYKDHWVALYQIRGSEGHGICTARSADLYNWVPDKGNPTFGPPP